MDRTAGYNASVMSGVDELSFDASFGFIPEAAKEGAVFDAPVLVNTSTAQVNNGVTSMGAKWGSLEGRGDNARIRLDGTWDFPTVGDSRQVGGWLDGTNTFRYIMAAANDIIGTTVYFDAPGGDWATSVRLRYLNASGTQVATGDFQNASPIGGFSLTGVGVKTIEVTILGWNVQDRAPKIAQVDPGLVFAFDMSNVIKFTLSESIRPFQLIQFPEAVIEVGGMGDDFDPTNPSGLVPFLEQGQMSITCNMTAGGQRVGVSDWLLAAWNDQNSDDTTFFTTQPGIAITTANYPNYTDTGSQTVAQAAAAILDGFEYTVDASLQSIVVNKYIGTDVSNQSAMSYLAMAVAGYWRFDRDGSCHLLPWENPTVVERDAPYSLQFDKPSFSRETIPTTGVEVPYYAPSSGSYGMGLSITDNLVGDNTGEVQRVSSPFLRTKAQADIVGVAALEYWSQRVKLSTAIQGDPILEPMEIISVQHKFGNVNTILETVKTEFTGVSVTKTSISGVI